MLNELINNADESDPMIYRLSNKQQIPLYEHSSPIHRKIYDKANMEMYELCVKIKDINPHSKLVSIKTDCLVLKILPIHRQHLINGVILKYQAYH